MTKSIEQQMPLVDAPFVLLGKACTKLGWKMATETQHSADAKWIEEQGLVRLPSEEWLHDWIVSMRHDFVLPASDHNVHELARVLLEALKEQGQG